MRISSFFFLRVEKMLDRSLRVFLKKETTEFGIDRPCILLMHLASFDSGNIHHTIQTDRYALPGLDVNLQNFLKKNTV
jgi:hypothetical protein